MSDELLPITRADSDNAAREFLGRWTPGALAASGLHQMIRDIMFHLQDHGDVIILKVDELTKLTNWLCEQGIDTEVFADDSDLSPELQSAMKKIFFAHGRCWGMTNYDMGIKEEDDGSTATS
jgi:hypothetical protein